VIPSAVSLDSVNPDLILTNIDRKIDLSTQLVKVSHAITVNNGGSGATKNIHFTVEKEFADKVVFIEATTGSTSDKDAPAWKVELKSALSPGAETKINVEVMLGKAVEMFPREITQREKQLVLFKGNHYVYSPYKIKSQTTKVLLPSSIVESYTKTLKPVAHSDATITYGPYANVEPFSSEELSVHYENNNPFLVVTRLERTVELSMWGNIAVEEILDVRHAGAALKGAFSRYEFQRENSGVSSVKNFKTVLPASASDVYYRDDIGNISTSALRQMDDAVELDLRPRFPLFGGWKTHYFIGYNVPSYEYLFSSGEKFALNMRLVDHIFDDMLVEDMTLKVILPEGAKVGQMHTPYKTLRLPDTKHYTYLDVQGRPVVTIQNVGQLTEKHIQDFQLEFVLPRLSMIQEPLLLIGAFLLFFALTIVYVRMDFAITKDEGSEARMKAAGVCEKIVGHQDRRNATYSSFDDAVSKWKTSKDSSAFANNTRRVNADHKSETQNIADLIPTLKAISGDAADRVSELQKLDRAYRDHQSTQAILIEKLVSGKLPKQQFVDQEAALVKKKVECLEKMNHITSLLRSY